MLFQFSRNKRNFLHEEQNKNENWRPFPVTVLFFSKRCGMREKHLAVNNVKFLSVENSRKHRRRNWHRNNWQSVIDIKFCKLQIGLTPADSWCRGKTRHNYRKMKSLHCSSGLTKL